MQSADSGAASDGGELGDRVFSAGDLQQQQQQTQQQQQAPVQRTISNLSAMSGFTAASTAEFAPEVGQ